MKMDGLYVRADYVSCKSDSWRNISLSDGSVLQMNTKILNCYSHFRQRAYERTEITVNIGNIGRSLNKIRSTDRLLYIAKLKVHVCLHCKTSLYCNFDKSYKRTRCDRCGRSA